MFPLVKGAKHWRCHLAANEHQCVLAFGVCGHPGIPDPVRRIGFQLLDFGQDFPFSVIGIQVFQNWNCHFIESVEVLAFERQVILDQGNG